MSAMKVRLWGNIMPICGSRNNWSSRLKAIQTLVKQHEVQLVNYLAATNIDSGLLLNFGPSVQVKRKFRESSLGPRLKLYLVSFVNPV
jgi:hypothetical protein